MSYTATYSPEDNKLRLYASSRLDAETYAEVKAAGFKWAPKQELFVAPTWTPSREDLLLDLCDEIGDEDYSPEERAADRAERFSGYRDKRRDEAGDHADTFEAGPSAFGHQNRDRAERQAARHDRHRVRAACQWSKAEYWQYRTAGVIRHALHKSSAAVRRSRILRLEAEQRKNAKNREEAVARWEAWNNLLTLDGLDLPISRKETDTYSGIDAAQTSQAGRFCYALVNTSGGWGNYKHPRTGRDASSLYSLLTDPIDPITPREAAALWFDKRDDPRDPESWTSRWARHYELRLGYEKAMLAEEGGTAAEAEMVPGGWICTGNRTGRVGLDVSTGWKQIESVHKSTATGRVTSVKVWGYSSGFIKESGYTEQRAVPCLVSVNIERLPEGAYRAPTPEELEAFKAEQKARKAETKAAKVPEPSLLNPTDDDAEHLQAVWNGWAKASHDKRVAAHETLSEFKPSAVRRMTQADYSKISKGAYSSAETRTLYHDGRLSRRSSNMWSGEGSAYDKSLTGPVCKIRMSTGNGFHGADCVIVLTDKPQKPLPLDWSNVPEVKPVVSRATVAH